MTDSIQCFEVTLQENGIVRNKDGLIIGRLVEDVDALCEEHQRRGRSMERRKSLNDAAMVVEGEASIHSLIRECVARAIRSLP